MQILNRRIEWSLQKRLHLYTSDKTPSVLYAGVAADLKDRFWKHRQGKGSVFIFTSRYNVQYLLYVEEHQTMLKTTEHEK